MMNYKLKKPKTMVGSFGLDQAQEATANAEKVMDVIRCPGKGPARSRSPWFLFVLCGFLFLAACGRQEAPVEEPTPVVTQEEKDLSAAFHGLQGCAVLYDPGAEHEIFYQRPLCQSRVSPCSTFKIVSTLMGLHSGVLSGPEATMDYSGAQYPVAAWNDNLTLQEAFQSSCVWYFRQVIDRVGEEAVAAQLAALDYGNQDISQWAGGGQNASPELNGFWLDSSLEISPYEQVRVLSAIFEGNTDYTSQEVAVLQSLMLVQTEGPRQIYGKTGTGFGSTGWFVGFFQEGEKRIYFAVYLADEAHQVSGSDAKAVALTLLTGEETMMAP